MTLPPNHTAFIRYVLWISLGVAACTPTEDPIEHPLLETVNDLISRVTDPEDGAATWPQVEPWTGVQPSTGGEHGPFAEIRMEPAAADVWPEDPPYETIIFLRGWDDPALPRDSWFAMQREPRFDDETDDWFWLRVDGDTAVRFGAVESCKDCHSGAIDYRWSASIAPAQ